MQVGEKRKIMDYEKSLNSEQAKIWNTDVNKFSNQEQEIYNKVILI